ncbi:MAG: 4-phytase, partial [Chloroflexales bacterium]|nr:4-phytase [Chloroflexales bacterium]
LAEVIGRRFRQRVLAALEAGEQALDERLADLVRGAFILPGARDGVDQSYLFRHALIQESTYATLLYERRRAYHHQVAVTLERLFPAEVVEQAATLASHYERADEPALAIGYQLQAGDSARLLGADREAEALYRRALALLDGRTPEDSDRRARIFLRLAATATARGDYGDAQAWHERADDLLGRAAARPRPAVPRTIRLGMFAGGPSTLDPGLLDTVGDQEIVPDLFEGLLELDAELNVRPALARRWTVDHEGRRYRFELRPGLRWSDGAPLTAHDVVFAWRRNLHPATGSGVADLLHVVAGADAYHAGEAADPATLGVRALDDQTLEVELEAPFSSLLYLLADPVSFPQPAHVYRERGADCFSPERLVCSGPFMVGVWRPGEEIVLERNPYYSRPLAGALDRAQLRFLPPSYANYLAGEIDLCTIEDSSEPAQRHPGESFVRQFLATYFLALDCARPPFDDPAARRALALVIDRAALVRAAWADVQLPADGGLVPPGIPGHTPELALRPDQQLARALLAARGPLPPLTLAALPGSGRAPRLLADMWRAGLGLEVDLAEEVAYHQIDAGLRDGRYQLALLGCDAPYPDPHAILADFAAGGLFDFGWRSPAFDGLVRGAMGIAEPRERMASYHRADRALVAEACAVIPLYYYRAFGLIRRGMRIAGAGRVVRGGALRLKHIEITAD